MNGATDPEPQERFVFLDPDGRRWQRIRVLTFLVALFAFAVSILFVRSLLVKPRLQLPGSVRQLRDRLKELERDERTALIGSRNGKAQWLEFSKPRLMADKMDRRGRAAGPTEVASRRAFPVLLGFYDDGDPAAMESLRAHAADLTHVCTSWMAFSDERGTITVKPDESLKSFTRKNGIVLMPILENSRAEERFPEAVEALAHSGPDRQKSFIDSLLAQLVAAGAGGVVLDWGQIDPQYRDELTELIARVSEALHKQSLELWLCVPMGLELNAFDMESLASHVDRFVAMLHDQNSEVDPPGPLASQEWLEGWLGAMVEYGEPSQWIAALGSYGYDWPSGGAKAQVVGFHDVMSRAGRAGVKQCRSMGPTYNPFFFYEADGVQHEVWFLDAATFLNQARAARKLGVGGLAISPLGFEDPAVWQAVALASADEWSLAQLKDIQVLRSEGLVTHVGKGELLTLDSSQSDGFRTFGIDRDGLVTEEYEKLPVYVTLSHQGEAGPREVALTFDDGPDPRWTPKILDLLKQEGAKASFFLVGGKMETHPELVRRIVREGHEVGIHTYTHPNIALISEERAFLELNATQLLFQSITGRSTVFFRPPYSADSSPRNLAEILPIRMAQQLGYLTVGVDIDPEDWDRPGTDAILRRIKQQRRAGGSIILLHDAGGDRRQTVEALPLILGYLKDRGDRIVSLSELMGEPLEAMMPPVKPGESQVSLMVSGGGFRVLRILEETVWSLMIVATLLLMLRTVVVVSLACRNKVKSLKEDDEACFEPPVSVILAAYNEEKVIADTLRDLLRSAYGGPLEVLVIDDGSTDATGDVVEAVTAGDGRVKLIRQANGGKARALRRGVESASHDILIMLDADTRFEKTTIREMVKPLHDPSVAAVSGRAMVGNPRTFITRCQALEYTMAFNLDRRAYHELDCITVVPGAVSALRRTALERVGGISTDTLAEDTDLTLSLHKAGFRVCHAAGAVAWTEAPETMAALVKQRSRWAFGTLQCLWKHTDLLCDTHKKALGWFSIPSVWVFQVLLVALAPFLDLTLVLSMLFRQDGPIYFYFLAFLMVDLALAASACLLERQRLSQVWLMIPMRFVYRALLSWVIWKSLLKAAKGAWVGWGKLERTASVPSRC